MIYNEIYDILKRIEIPKVQRRTISDEKVRTVTLGYVKQPFSKYRGLSKFTERHPELYKKLIELHDSIDRDHKFTSITINHNVRCKPHRDKLNLGDTIIVAIGDYTGGRLVIDGLPIDINRKPKYFNGYLHEHYNEEHIGDRYSIMFYAIRSTLPIDHRPEDVPIVREVYYGNQYHKGDIGFGINHGDHWIDIGGHIGCFAKKCLDNGATVHAYEPDPSSYEYLCTNIGSERCTLAAVHAGRDGECMLIKGSKPYFNKIMDGSGTELLSFNSILTPDCCVKMDIEGGELAIIDNCDFSGIRKMVIAYHTNVDRSVDNFNRRMARLSRWFLISHQKVKGTYFNMFPNEIIVYCSPILDRST